MYAAHIFAVYSLSSNPSCAGSIIYPFKLKIHPDSLFCSSQILAFLPPNGPLAHLGPIPALDTHLVQVHLPGFPREREEEAPPAALLTEEPLDESVVASVMLRLVN